MELTYLILSFSVKYHVDYSRLREYDDRSELFRLYTQPEELVSQAVRKLLKLHVKWLALKQTPTRRLF